VRKQWRFEERTWQLTGCRLKDMDHQGNGQGASFEVADVLAAEAMD
jgi:hypothetical protein